MNHPVTREREFRPEIQLLRALAVAAVVVFHLFPAVLPGGFIGVDVFFVISGYLITRHLLRELEADGRVRFGAFYARRIRRLLPAAFLVLGVTLVGVLVLMPQTSWPEELRQIGASAIYVENWALALNSTDYFAADAAPTAVQHYWSLSVEEQFYLVWPLLLTLAAFWSLNRRRSVLIALMAVGIGSLVASILVTAAAPSFAYFSTLSHGWEFALGGLVIWIERAVNRAAEPRPALGAALTVAGWLGVAGIVVCSFLYTGAMPFPGWIALGPTLAAALVLVAGARMSVGAFRPIVAAASVQWAGDASYSIYLWHWPLIVLAVPLLGRSLDPVALFAILALTLVLAEVTRRFVENPIRTSPALRRRTVLTFAGAASVSVLLLGACAVPAIAVQREAEASAAIAAEQLAEELEAAEDPDGPKSCFGAGALLNDGCDPGHTVNPRLGPAFAITDGQTDGDELESDEEFDCRAVTDSVGECVFGDPETQPTFAVVGDSHMAQYRPLFLEFARKYGWAMLSYVRGACLPTLPTFEYPLPDPWEMRPECQDWKADVIDVVADSGAQVVVTASASRLVPIEHPDFTDEVTDAFSESWERWTDAGQRVVVIGDNPFLDQGVVPKCIAESDSPVDPCTRPRDDAAPADPALIAASGKAGITSVDVAPALCDPTTCHAVVGEVIAYHDLHHLSETFVWTLRPIIEPLVVAAMSDASGAD